MKPGDSANNYAQYCIQNIASATPWVKFVHESNHIDSINNAINIKETHKW